MKTETFARIPPDDDTPFERAGDRWCKARNKFGEMRRWPGLCEHVGPAGADEVRAAARELRDACDQIADMPTWTSDGQATGGDYGEKTQMVGYVLCDAEAFNERWLIEVARRMASRINAAHPEELPPVEDGEAQ